MKKLLLILLLAQKTCSIPVIKPGQNFTSFLRREQQLPQNKIKLHLGCGQAHLNGYINIDFPPSEHTVQKTSGADIYGDITKLSFNPLSIAEIRSHHVFEHFNRQKALSLLAIWHYSLTENGTLIIETPDFEESIRMLLSSNYSYSDKQIILRHIFGSHEAFWATHYDGWYEEKFRHILSKLNFQISVINKAAYLQTRNITITAKKITNLSKEELQKRCHELLREHMVNNNIDEKEMWHVWCKEFDDSFLPYALD